MGRSVVLVGATSLVVGLAATSCGTGESPEPSPAEAAPTVEAATEAAVGPAAARLARGEYIAEGLAHCFYCHSKIDFEADRYVPLEGTVGGGQIFPEMADIPPGFHSAPNITPDETTGIGTWSDEEIAVAIREGVTPDGRRLFPLMPYPSFRRISDEDVAAVVAYLRTLEPIESDLPANEIPEEIVATFPPHEAITEPVVAPDPSDRVAYGEYLAAIGNCFDCHTPMRGGQPIGELAFAGGRNLGGPWGEPIHSPNLTSAPSGIPYYDEALFIEAVRECKVRGRRLSRIMPCDYYASVTDEDLGAIFAFVRSLPPIEHRVSNTDPPTLCPLCGEEHGLGETNEPPG